MLDAAMGDERMGDARMGDECMADAPMAHQWSQGVTAESHMLKIVCASCAPAEIAEKRYRKKTLDR